VTWVARQAARWHQAAVPDRLTGVLPEWLVSAMRPKPAPIPWAEMARAALAICGPMSTGILTGDPSLGLLMAMGGLFGSVVDNGGTFANRLRRVGSAAVFGGAAGLFIGSLLHGQGWIAVIVLVIVAGASALLSSISGIGSVTGLQLMVYTSLGFGPLGALRPWWHTALGFLLGVAWALILIVPGWLFSPRAAERRSVAAAYRALADALRAAGSESSQAGRGVTTALNNAYDALLTFRTTTGGRNSQLIRLVALLNQGNLIAEATTTLRIEGTRPPPGLGDTLDAVAETIRDGAPPPRLPEVRGTTPGIIALRDDLNGLTAVLSGNWPATVLPVRRPPMRDRFRAANERLTGRLTWIFAVRLMACVAVAVVASEILPLQRSYWVVLTVIIVIKPDMGSVFVRAVQSGVGTIIGAVLGAIILAVVPYGLWLLLPFAVLAALLPYGRSRNYGLFAIFLTPLVVLLIDLLAPGGWQLALDRLVDTLLGCAIVLLVGYALWPSSWQAHLPGQFATTIKVICQYMREALVPAEAAGDTQPAGTKADTQPPGMRAVGTQAAGTQPLRQAPPRIAARPPDRPRLRRQALRALSDLRAELERTMGEPQAVSRRAAALWPAVAGLERVIKAVTATAVAIGQGVPAPDPGAVRQLTAALEAVAEAATRGGPPNEIPLPSDERLQPVTATVRAVLGVTACLGRPGSGELAATIGASGPLT
jgi:uncharacterized membrane protein YccC